MGDLDRKGIILIVNDSPMIVDVIFAMLERNGYRPVAAYSGEECLEILGDGGWNPDLILLNWHMDPLDGWDSPERIKVNPGTKDIPVIMHSTHQVTAEIVAEFGTLYDGFLTMPFTHKQFYAAAGAAITKTRAK